MADNGDKTEKASAQKLKKAREEGQVVRSKDLSTAIGILVSLKMFSLMLPTYLESFRSLFRLVFVPLGETGVIDTSLPRAGAATVYSRFGDLFFAGVVASLLLAGVLVRRR